MGDIKQCPVFKDDTCIFHNCKYYNPDKGAESCRFEEMRAFQRLAGGEVKEEHKASTKQE